MKFSSGKEMYEVVASGVDLYNENERLYVFAYNDAGALCCYSLNSESARIVAEQAAAGDEYWGAFLGWGGDILDDMAYDRFRYSDVDSERDLYLRPSYEFCEECYSADGWQTTDEWANK